MVVNLKTQNLFVFVRMVNHLITKQMLLILLIKMGSAIHVISSNKAIVNNSTETLLICKDILIASDKDNATVEC